MMPLRSVLPTLAASAALLLASCVVDNTMSSGTPAPTAPTMPAPGADGPPPDLRTKPNGDIEVVFASGCVAIFDRNGNLLMGGRDCDDVDLHRARQAVQAYLAEQRSSFNDV